MTLAAGQGVLRPLPSSGAWPTALFRNDSTCRQGAQTQLSPSHFSRAFKRAVGTGPQRYTVQRRVQRAKGLLRHGGDSLAVIAVAAGFADQSHFTAVFRRETGVTPGRFRGA